MFANDPDPFGKVEQLAHYEIKTSESDEQRGPMSAWFKLPTKRMNKKVEAPQINPFAEPNQPSEPKEQK